jgi:hypothetical protein
MALVNIVWIVDHLSSGMRRALADAVEEVLPGANIESQALFRAFKRALAHKCSTWENVPDDYVKAD